MPIYQLPDNELVFPSPHLANEYGVLAIGGDLSPERLCLAYQEGIFPWFNEGEPIIWWSPDPRFVLFPEEIKVAKSMRSIFNKKKFQYSFDKDFRAVINQCRATRLGPHDEGTWITDDMIEAYCRLHELGIAHSVEVWQNNELVGGLYGISLGKVFFGESMFTKVSNASKAGFITLTKILLDKGFTMIDCQQETSHLGSLGARAISREDFLDHLAINKTKDSFIGPWSHWITKEA